MIEKYEDKFDWIWLSLNENLPWSEDLIEKYEDKWDWNLLSFNKNLIWSEDLIEKYKNNWNWYNLSNNANFSLSIKLIYKYFDKIVSSQHIWNTLKPFLDDEMVLKLLKEIKLNKNE